MSKKRKTNGGTALLEYLILEKCNGGESTTIVIRRDNQPDALTGTYASGTEAIAVIVAAEARMEGGHNGRNQ